VSPSENIDRVVPIEPDQTASHPEYFYISRDSVLLDRSKRQEIFGGSFGVIVAQTDYRYESEYGPGYGAPSITFGARADKSNIRREPPNVISELPAPATPLNMISLIRIVTLDLNPAHSTCGMPLNRLIDGPYRRFWYSEPYLTFSEVRLRCVGRHEIYESPVIIGV
jgi:hypothetical protein